MVAPEDVLADSPADFNSSFAYALHAEMRRLLIVTIVGSLLLPIGLAIFIDPSYWTFAPPANLVIRLIGLGLAIVGAAFFYGGVVAVLFKIITDATIVAQVTEESA